MLSYAVNLQGLDKITETPENIMKSNKYYQCEAVIFFESVSERC